MSKSEKDHAVDEVFGVLIRREMQQEKICKTVPQRVQHNTAFLVDTGSLESPEDILSDNCGAWKCDGVRYYYFESSFQNSSSETDDVEFKKVNKNATKETLTSPWYKICRKYYRNRDALDFRRVISYLIGKTSEKALVRRSNRPVR